MPVALYIVDAFTNVRFAGNPAAICLLTDRADVNWMQNVAAEMNLSETAHQEEPLNFGLVMSMC